MPRHDPLTPYNPRRPLGAPESHREWDDIAALRKKLAVAERAAEEAIRERDLLRRQLRGRGDRLREVNPIDASVVRIAFEGSLGWVLRAIVKGRGKRRRKPPEAGLPVPAIPPRGPLPLQGGAEAPLEFDD